MINKNSVGVVSSLDKEIQDKFSGSWYVYRVASHPQGGFDLAAKFLSDKYSTRTLFNMIEMFDVYDSQKEQAASKAKSNTQK